ncbi:MAG: hypothetical protein LQ346_007285 [Caloplaca aetnensis]|nr:MAG: hypothetical protein LQ346_007285 [Caloplaca aetnensis]
MSLFGMIKSALQPLLNWASLVTLAHPFQQPWTSPTILVPILMALRIDCVHKALAQLAGGILVPVPFSFGTYTPRHIPSSHLRSNKLPGWASYAVKNLLYASVGDAVLMPPAEAPCLVFNAKSGHGRNNASWLIGRVFRDYESWMDTAVRARIAELLDERNHHLQQSSKGTAPPRPRQAGLCISVYAPSKSKRAGVPTHGLLYWTGLVVVLMQMVIAAVPFALSGDMSIRRITLGGTILALTTGSLSQWKAEKWACRRKSSDPYILTSGNGAQHVIMILGNGQGLHLEDLAAGKTRRSSSISSRLYIAGVSFLWLCLLVFAAGLAQNTGYLLAIGSIGTLQNVFASSLSQNPSMLGVHLEFMEVVGETKVFAALKALEGKYKGAGQCLLREFFPGGLRPGEQEEWDTLTGRAAEGQDEGVSQARKD